MAHRLYAHEDCPTLSTVKWTREAGSAQRSRSQAWHSRRPGTATARHVGHDHFRLNGASDGKLIVTPLWPFPSWQSGNYLDELSTSPIAACVFAGPPLGLPNR